VSPYEIKILLTIYASPEWRENLDLPINDLWYQTIQKFKDDGFLGPEDQRTEKLIVYCHALCRVPMPVQRWVMPEEEK